MQDPHYGKQTKTIEETRSTLIETIKRTSTRKDAGNGRENWEVRVRMRYVLSVTCCVEREPAERGRERGRERPSLLPLSPFLSSIILLIPSLISPTPTFTPSPNFLLIVGMHGIRSKLIAARWSMEIRLLNNYRRRQLKKQTMPQRRNEERSWSVEEGNEEAM